MTTLIGKIITLPKRMKKKFLGPNEQPPCGQCNFVKFILKGNDTGQYICTHCGFRISEEEYKLWKKDEL